MGYVTYVDRFAGTLAGLRDQPVLTPTAGAPGGVGIRLEHPAGTLGIWIELGSGRVLTAEDRTLLSLVCGYLGQALHRAYQTDQQRETALALQRAILGPSRLPPGFAARYEPASRPLEGVDRARSRPRSARGRSRPG